jgi:hypothetical protein
MSFHWQAALMIGGWVYASCGMLFVLATKRDLLARSSRELFSKFPDLAIALGIVIALLPQVVTKYALASLFN